MRVLGVVEQALDLLSKHKEWIFSGVGVAAIVALIALLRGVFRTPLAITREEPTTTTQAPALQPPPSQPSPPASQPKHVTVYLANEPLDPRVTPDEVAILKRFCSFPRGLHTQGYRDDLLFNELLPDIPTASLHLFLESLFIKGYVAIHTTEDGWYKYYRLSEAGVRYAVNTGLVKLNDA